jgi:hypothetical protein
MEFGDVAGALATINFDTDVYRRAVGGTLAAISDARGTASVSTVTYTARAFTRAGATCTLDDVCAALKRRGRALGITCVVMESEPDKASKTTSKFKRRVFRNCVSFKMDDDDARVSVKIFRTLAVNVTGATGLSSIERVNRRVRALLCSAARGGDSASDEHAVEVRVWSIDMTQVAWFTCDATSAIDVQKLHNLAVDTINEDTGPWKVASLEMHRHTALRLSSHATGERADSKVSACVWPCGTITLVGKDPARARAAVHWLAHALASCRITLSVPRKLTPAHVASRA